MSDAVPTGIDVTFPCWSRDVAAVWIKNSGNGAKITIISIGNTLYNKKMGSKYRIAFRGEFFRSIGKVLYNTECKWYGLVERSKCEGKVSLIDQNHRKLILSERRIAVWMEDGKNPKMNKKEHVKIKLRIAERPRFHRHTHGKI